MVNAVHTTMTSSASRSNSPTSFSLSGTRSRSTSASQFGQKLKGLFKFGTNSISSNKSSHSSSTEHLPRLPTPPAERNGGTVSINPYFHHQGLPPHQLNGTSTGQSSADGMDSLGG